MTNGKNTDKNDTVDHRRQDVRQAIKNDDIAHVPFSIPRNRKIKNEKW